MNDSTYSDRRAGLIAGGVLQIVRGLACLGLAGLTVLGVILAAKTEAPGAALNFRMGTAGALFYVAHAVLFFWLGIGSIMARRWARALALTGSCLWLLFGTVGMASWLLMLPKTADAMSASGPMPYGSQMVVLAVTTAFVGLIYMALPFAFFLLYRGKDMRATVEARDPHARWTDRCPLPVLALGILLIYAAAGFATLLSYGAVPLFGRILMGLPATAFVLAVVAINLVLAVGVCRLRPWAWWSTLVYTLVGVAVTFGTFREGLQTDWYRAVGMPEEQIAYTAKLVGAGYATPLWLILWGALFVGYLLYVRKFFRAATSA